MTGNLGIEVNDVMVFRLYIHDGHECSGISVVNGTVSCNGYVKRGRSEISCLFGSEVIDSTFLYPCKGSLSVTYGNIICREFLPEVFREHKSNLHIAELALHADWSHLTCNDLEFLLASKDREIPRCLLMYR